MDEVPLSGLPTDRFEPLIGPERYASFLEALDRGRRALAGRTLWHVNSTAEGGGVAEMLRFLLGYLDGAGIATRWAVVQGDEPFFDVTKRIHHHLHGEPGDGGELGDAERVVYERTLGANADPLTAAVSPGDVVVLHDPQALGLAPALTEAGARVVWSCHIGADEPNELVRSAWSFLRPYLEPTSARVFSRQAYVWEGIDEDRVALIPPCIDAFAPKNQDLEEAASGAILDRAGLVTDGDGQARFRRLDGSSATVSRPADLVGDGPLPADARIVVQVSRWDPLKDPVGVLRGFVEHVDRGLDAHLVLAGPAADSVADDPEADEVLDAVVEERDGLDPRDRARVHVACLPMDDLEENAAIVNALQRRAEVIVQKSLAEGFGLTVAEGMWKERPVVGSRVGGIQDQIEHGRSGVLVDDPEDLPAFGAAVTGVLQDPEAAASLGTAAHARVAEEYLAPRYLGRWLDLMDRVVSDGA